MARNTRRDRRGRHKAHVPQLTAWDTCSVCNVHMTLKTMFVNDRHLSFAELATPTVSDWAMLAANDGTG